MEAIGPIYLDTNVFIAAFEAQNEISELLLTLFSGAGRRFVTSEMTLAELMVLPLRNNDAAHIALYSAMFMPSEWLQVRSVTREVCVRSASLRANASSRKLPDAIHLATAILSGCTHLLSQDKGIGAKPGEILGISVIRPDEATLDTLIESLSV